MMYDQQYEVSKRDLQILRKYCSGLIAWRELNDKFYVKSWCGARSKSYLNNVLKYITLIS